jgi:hypothetical protein
MPHQACYQCSKSVSSTSVPSCHNRTRQRTAQLVSFRPSAQATSAAGLHLGPFSPSTQQSCGHEAVSEVTTVVTERGAPLDVFTQDSNGWSDISATLYNFSTIHWYWFMAAVCTRLASITSSICSCRLRFSPSQRSLYMPLRSRVAH